MYKRYWLVSVTQKGFESRFLMYGKEQDIQEYMVSEWGHTLAYSGASDQEVAAARMLGIKAYIAPEA